MNLNSPRFIKKQSEDLKSADLKNFNLFGGVGASALGSGGLSLDGLKNMTDMVKLNTTSCQAKNLDENGVPFAFGSQTNTKKRLGDDFLLWMAVGANNMQKHQNKGIDMKAMLKSVVIDHHGRARPKFVN